MVNSPLLSLNTTDPLLVILKYVNLSSLLSLRATCKHFYNLLFSKDDKNYLEFLDRYWNSNPEKLCLTPPAAFLTFKVAKYLRHYHPNLILSLEEHDNDPLREFTSSEKHLTNWDRGLFNRSVNCGELSKRLRSGSTWTFVQSKTDGRFTAVCYRWNAESKKLETTASILLEKPSNGMNFIRRIFHHEDKLYCLHYSTFFVFSAVDGKFIKTIQVFNEDYESFAATEAKGTVYFVCNYNDDNRYTHSKVFISEFEWETEKLKTLNIKNLAIEMENCGDGVSDVQPLFMKDGSLCLEIEERGSYDKAITLYNVDTNKIVFSSFARGITTFNTTGTKLMKMDQEEDSFSCYKIVGGSSKALWQKSVTFGEDCITDDSNWFLTENLFATDYGYYGNVNTEEFIPVSGCYRVCVVADQWIVQFSKAVIPNFSITLEYFTQFKHKGLKLEDEDHQEVITEEEGSDSVDEEEEDLSEDEFENANEEDEDEEQKKEDVIVQ